MKKIILSLVAVVALALTLVSCSTNSPKASAEKFLNGLNHMDYEAAKSVSTEETKKLLDMLSQFSAMMPDSAKETAKKIKVNIGKEEINGDKATVYYTTSENNAEQKLNLVKEKNKWLVEFSKNDAGMGGGNAPAEEEPMAPVTDSAVNMNDTAAIAPAN